MEMHLRGGNGRETTNGSVDSWKTDGCNGDSGYTNRTSTTIPLNRNSINSSAASADFQRNPTTNMNPPDTIPSQSSLVNSRLSSSPYIMPMPPGVHPNIEDVINSHHVLSSPNKNNICRETQAKSLNCNGFSQSFIGSASPPAAMTSQNYLQLLHEKSDSFPCNLASYANMTNNSIQSDTQPTSNINSLPYLNKEETYQDLPTLPEKLIIRSKIDNNDIGGG